MSDSEKPTISASQVAVLAAKVDTVIENFSEMKGLLHGMSQQFLMLNNNVSVLQEKVAQAERDANEVKKAAFHQGGLVNKMRDELTRHTTIWRIVGAASGIACVLVGWNFNTLMGLDKMHQRHDNRITLLEFQVGGRRTPPPAPPEMETPR